MKTAKIPVNNESLDLLSSVLTERLCYYNPNHDYDADLSPEAKEYLAANGIPQLNPYPLYDSLDLSSTDTINREKEEYFNCVNLMLPEILTTEDYSLITEADITIDGTCDLEAILSLNGLSDSAKDEIQQLIIDADTDWAILYKAETQMENMYRLYHELPDSV